MQLSVFLDEQDAQIFIARLNQDQEIAFIVPDGPNRWKAVSSVASLNDGDHSLWHVPGEPLTLLGADGSKENIVDPWRGWTQQVTQSYQTVPYFSADHPAEIRLSLYTRHRPYSEQERNELTYFNGILLGENDYMMVSSFYWIGNYNGPAPRSTHQWWRRLKKWVEHEAVKLKPYNNFKSKFDRLNFWAFPSAFHKLKNGMEYDCRGFDLTKALEEASFKDATEIVLAEDAKPLSTDVVLGGDAKPRPTDVVLGSKHHK